MPTVDISKLPLPAYASEAALQALEATPVPGPAVAKALRKLPGNESSLLETALVTLAEEYPLDPEDSTARDLFRADALMVLKLASTSLTETDDGVEAQARHHAMRTIFGARPMPGFRRIIREAARRMGRHFEAEAKGPGGAAVAREIIRVGAAITGEPPVLPMIAHIATARPPRHISAEECAMVLKAHANLRYVVSAAQLCGEMEGKLLPEALGSLSTTADHLRHLVTAAIPDLFRVSIQAMIRGDVTIIQREASELGGILAGLDADTENVTAAIHRLIGACRSQLDPWTAAMITGYLEHADEALSINPPRFPDYRSMRSMSLGDPDLETCAVQVAGAETRLVRLALDKLQAQGTKVANAAYLSRLLNGTLRASVRMLLTGEEMPFDRYFLHELRLLPKRSRLSPNDVALGIRALADVMRENLPATLSLITFIEEAAELVSFDYPKVGQTLDSGILDLLKREAKIVDSALLALHKVWPRLNSIFAKEVSTFLKPALGQALRAVVDVMAGRDQTRFERRIRRLARALDRHGFPAPLQDAFMPELASAAALPALQEWFEAGRAIIDAAPPEPITLPAEVTDPTRRRAVQHIVDNETTIANAAVDATLKEMPFMHKVVPGVDDVCRRDEAYLLRYLALGVATNDYHALHRHMLRQAGLLPRVGVPKAALRRTLAHLRTHTLSGLEQPVQRLLEPAFDAADEASHRDGWGLSSIMALLERFEGRMPTPQDRALLSRMDPAAEPILAICDQLAGAGPHIVKEITEKVFAQFEYDKKHFNAKAKCSRDILLVLTYSCHGLVLGSPEYLDRKLLQWLRTIFQAFEFPGKGDSVRMTYQMLHDLTAARLGAEQAPPILPFLELARDVLPAPGLGAVLAGKETATEAAS